MEETNKNLVVEKVKKWDEELDKYEKELKLPPLKSPGTEEELESYLVMPLNEIQKLTQSQCAEISYRLSQFSFFLTRTQNKNYGRIKRLQSLFDLYVSDKIGAFNKYSKYEEKINCLCQKDKYAYDILMLKIQFENRYNRLNQLSDSIDRMANSIKNLSFSKRGEHG